MMLHRVLLGVGLCLSASVAVAILPPNGQQAQSTPEQHGDAARGKAVFEHRCTGCHALDADREGPRLRDVYGRKAASVAGFEYSKSLAHLELTWTAATLDQWLTDPDAMVPENNMSFATPKATDRRDLIAFLQQAAEKSLSEGDGRSH